MDYVVDDGGWPDRWVARDSPTPAQRQALDAWKAGLRIEPRSHQTTTTAWPQGTHADAELRAGYLIEAGVFAVITVSESPNEVRILYIGNDPPDDFVITVAS